MQIAAQTFAEIRATFPGTEQLIYLDVAARGLISRPVREAINRHLDHRMAEGADKPAMFDQVERTRARFARFIGADADEISFSKNVSDGINAFALAVLWEAGDSVVICESLEHPANVFPWRNLAKLKGIELKIIEPKHGRIPLQQLIEAIDPRTRVVALSSISFSPGFLFPIAELGAECRRRGVYLVVDAAQSIGVIGTDVSRLQIDALATSMQKGLLAVYGAGFLYVRRAIAEQLAPKYLSRFGVALASEHEAARGDLEQYELAEGARRFDVGNYNYIASVAVERSLQVLQSIGIEAIEKHARGLAKRLAHGLEDLGLPVFGGASAPDRAHMVTLGAALSDKHDTTDDAAILHLHQHLTNNKVRATIRRGMLRFSMHAYNNADDVDAVIDLAKSWQKSRTTSTARAKMRASGA
jgi:selenocysteine lyase/cysteine desulfurase